MAKEGVLLQQDILLLVKHRYFSVIFFIFAFNFCFERSIAIANNSTFIPICVPLTAEIIENIFWYYIQKINFKNS